MFTFNPSPSCNHINLREHALQRMVHQIKHAHSATQTWPFLSKNGPNCATNSFVVVSLRR